jgi:hypothetical protein
MTLRERFVDNPDSTTIAEQLDARDAEFCPCGKNPCYSVCGVRRLAARWSVISSRRRHEWLENVCRLVERDKQLAKPGTGGGV